MTVTDSTEAAPEKTLKDGRVVAIAGPVVDAEFPPDGIPEINFAVQFDIVLEGDTITVTGEVAQQIGESRVRIICLKPTDGLRRGTIVRNLGHGLQMPVGEVTLGHVFNVLGEQLDTLPLGEVKERWDIHRPPPAFDTLEPSAKMFETRIKVIDLLTPYKEGGKIGLFGGAGVAKTVLLPRVIRRLPPHPGGLSVFAAVGHPTP